MEGGAKAHPSSNATKDQNENFPAQSQVRFPAQT